MTRVVAALISLASLLGVHDSNRCSPYFPRITAGCAVQVWDQDIMSKDDHMGVVLIPLRQIKQRVVDAHTRTHQYTPSH